MIQTLQTIDGFLRKPFKPNSDYQFFDDKYSIVRDRLAPWIGIIAFALPLSIMIAVNLDWLENRNSISHYYYSVFMGDFFIVSLAFVGTFMIAYKGESLIESLLATVGGFCCYGVVLFPTDGSGLEPNAAANGRIFVDMASIPHGSTEPIVIEAPGLFEETAFELFSGAAAWHLFFAAALFVILAIFCLFIFTRTKDNQRDDKTKALKKVKLTRNILYYICGLVILFCIGLIGVSEYLGVSWDENDYTFVFESIALITFGIAWMTKGKFWGLLAD